MAINDQIRLDDISEEYKAFVEKFKPKKTTDDCYTPQNVYEAVLGWVVKEYGINPNNIVRPFWPGGDYERENYPEGCTVVDNPPFSIITQICRTYLRHGIKFFLFAPYLTNFSISANGLCHIVCDVGIMYENGAIVNTSFVTNLDEVYEIRSAPDLTAAILEEDRKNRAEIVRSLPKYEYPMNVLTSSMVGRFGSRGIDFRVKYEDCYWVRSLNSQRAKGKVIFGGGYLISEKAAAEKAAAERAATKKAAVWELDEEEIAIIKSLGGREE